MWAHWSTHFIAATLDLQKALLRKQGCVDLPLFHLPWQYLQQTAIEYAAKALMRAESTTRTVLHDVQHVDEKS